MPEEKPFDIKVRGEDRLDAVPALYSNFVGISRLGTDVQLEFVFLDLNYLVELVERMKKGEAVGSEPIEGQTVAKIVMPGHMFLQLKNHLDGLFKALAEALPQQERQDERAPIKAG